MLFLNSNICRSDQWYDDSFAIKIEDVLKWRFINDGKKIIVDQNGYEYKKISDDVKDYNRIYDFILNSLLKDFVNEDFKISGRSLIVDNKKYRLNLNSSYTDDYVSLFLAGESRCFIIISDNDLKMVKAKRNSDFYMQFDPTDEIIYECKK